MRFRLIVDIDIDLNGVAPETIRGNLAMIPSHAFAEGTITGDTEALVDDFRISCEVVG